MRNIHPKFAFIRGTTPQLAFDLPVELDPEQYQFHVTFSQGFQPVLELISGNENLTVAQDKIHVQLTQEETLLFRVGDVDVQIDYVSLDGAVRDSSNPVYGVALRTLKEGVI